VLPAFFHPAALVTAKYRYDFYDVQSDLVAENYFGQIERWCRKHGVASSGYMLLEESLRFHVMFSGSMLKNWSRMDLPGIDLLGAAPYDSMAGWNGTAVDVPEDLSCKMASSVAHFTGKQGTFTESFAVAGPRYSSILGHVPALISASNRSQRSYHFRGDDLDSLFAFWIFTGRLLWRTYQRPASLRQFTRVVLAGEVHDQLEVPMSLAVKVIEIPDHKVVGCDYSGFPPSQKAHVDVVGIDGRGRAPLHCHMQAPPQKLNCCVGRDCSTARYVIGHTRWHERSRDCGVLHRPTFHSTWTRPETSEGRRGVARFAPTR
jgi:hypothetical protein